MRANGTWTAILLIAALPAGCAQESTPPASPAPGPVPTPAVAPVPAPAPAPAPVASQPKSPDTGVDDATRILKDLNASIKASGPAPPGVNQSWTQVGSHRIKTSMDVFASTELKDERAVISFGGRTLVVEFDRAQVVLDDTRKASLPAAVKEVAVQFVGGTLTVTADGTPVLTVGPPQ
jgi:hypothetical protein